ncbi:GFA family protein [Bradyrhizobium erythrophlei]|uniref:Uncharacterized conserved protein n=1 Tax=Bradyrhizobium erythrophlei TaxID=1437360 RepID=A0A1H4TWE3_9BRAD|nr:GFA family protein [Bradyrhizobium erythrophlei]SEC60843.1 Uncharacterized conserved protein [Bradyrhizobium erythrophlei]
MLSGGCHCGEIKFEVPDQAAFSTVCYCHDCRRQSGAPMLAWAMVPKAAVLIQGKPKIYSSSESGQRSFCPTCGAGLFFSNGILDRMGMMQVRIAALDDPNSISPRVQVQTAERVGWVGSLHDLPAFERFPS